MPSMETPLQSITASMLTSVYGQERSKAIVKYIQDFIPYASNFQPIVGAVREQRTAGLAGQQLLYLTCPLLVQCRDAGSTVLVVNVLFPVQFPDRAPFVLLVLPTNAHIKRDHSFIAQNGIIRLSMLPLLQNGPLPPYSICEILLAITDALENAYPFVANNDASSSGGCLPSPSSPAPSLGASSVASEQQAGKFVAATEGQQSQSRSPATPLPPPPSASVLRAAEALMLHLGKTAIETYMATQQEVMALRGALKVDASAMENEQVQLEQKASALASLKADTDALRKLLDAVGGDVAVPTESSKLLVPTDDTSSVALQLLSDIHAYDDAMQLEEQLLRKGIISPDDYTKVVSDLARAQFRSRYRYDRLLVSLEPPDARSVPPPPAPLVGSIASAPAGVRDGGGPTTSMPVGSPATEEGPRDPIISEADSIRMLHNEFQAVLDGGIIDDVWEATKSLSTARMELRAIAGQ